MKFEKIYEIRISKYIIEDKWLLKIHNTRLDDEPFVKIELEDTMDKAYEAAKKEFKQEAFSKALK